MLEKFLSATSENETYTIAAKLAASISSGCIIYLFGPLGVGKTTFTRGLLRALNYQEKVKSPTYTLVETYELANGSLHHFDLYRIKNANELEFLGLADYFAEDAIIIVEWAEKGFPLLPPADIHCYIETANQKRLIKFEAKSACGVHVLEKWS